MRSSCIARWSSAFGCVLALGAPAPADAPGSALDLIPIAPPDAVLRYTVIGREVAVMPQDVAAIEISESGGITDIFIRLSPDATATMAALTDAVIGTPLIIRVCGTVLLEATVQARIDSGTIYIPGTNALRAEAMRALWHGRARCDTVAPEVFEHGQR